MYLRATFLFLSLAIAYSQDVKVSFFAGRRTDGGGMMPPPPPEALRRRAWGVQTKWFDQKLDHFDITNTKRWQQRYQINDGVYKPGGPIFVWIGGEAAISSTWLVYGQMVQNGRKHGALLVQLEHRYYGESKPTADTSTANLKYLSSVQALADLDAFIKAIKAEYKVPNAKVVVFGCSYPGALAAWYRTLYPKSVNGAVASSAPILAKENFIEYLEVVGGAFSYFNPQCYSAVQQAFSTLSNIWDTANDAELKKHFSLCGSQTIDYRNTNERNSFFYMYLLSPLMGKIQYNAVGNNSEIAQFCVAMTSSTGTPLQRLANWMKANNPATCAYHSPWPMTYGSDVSWTDSIVQEGTRQWLYQTCTEFAYYYSTDSRNQPFGQNVGLNYLKGICETAFNIPANTVGAKVDETNRRYGGRSPNGTNIFFLNGSIDPWYRLSAYERDLNPSSPSRFIQGISHCYDIFEAKTGDPPSLTQARQDLANSIAKWVQ